MMDEEAKKFIHEQAEVVKQKLKNSTIFGYPVDINDIDMAIMAAYGCGQMEEMRKNAHDWAFLNNLRDA